MRGKKGFTLIEAMILLAVIGMIVAIAIPQFEKKREQYKAQEATAGNSVTPSGSLSSQPVYGTEIVELVQLARTDSLIIYLMKYEGNKYIINNKGGIILHKW